MKIANIRSLSLVILLFGLSNCFQVNSNFLKKTSRSIPQSIKEIEFSIYQSSMGSSDLKAIAAVANDDTETKKQPSANFKVALVTVSIVAVLLIAAATGKVI